MKKVHRLSRTWQLLLLGSCAGFLAIMLFVFLSGSASVRDSGFAFFLLFFASMLAMTYGVLSSRITTSKEGIECVSFGVRFFKTWDKVERLDVNGFGFVNLVFKEPLFGRLVINRLMQPLGYDRTLQLSPYLDDLAQSPLLEEIARYLPGILLPARISTPGHTRRPFQKVGNILLYYLAWLVAMVGFVYVFDQAVDILETRGLSGLSMVTGLVFGSLVLGLLINGLGLLGYNAEVVSLPSGDAVRRARVRYLAPAVVLVTSLAVGLGLWALLQVFSVLLSETGNNLLTLLAFVIAYISLKLSKRVERILYRD